MTRKELFERFKSYHNGFENRFFQTFDDANLGRRNLLRCQKNMTFEELDQLNKQGAGIYFCVNPINGEKRIEKNVAEICYLYVDMDNGTKEEMLEKIDKCSIKPTITIESKNGFHLYFSCSFEEIYWRKIINGMIQYYDGDTAIASLNEVLRIPGFFHLKQPNDPFLVRIHNETGNHWDSPEDLLKTFPYITPEEEATVKHNLRKSDLELLKEIPIKEVLNRLGVVVKYNAIWEKGEMTSARIKNNYVNRFSGKPGSGSTIDVVMSYGNKQLPEAIHWLRTQFNIPQKEAPLKPNETKVVNIPPMTELFQRLKDFRFDVLHINNLFDRFRFLLRCSVTRLGGFSNMGKSMLSYYLVKLLLQNGYKGIVFSSEVVSEIVLANLIKTIDGVEFFNIIKHNHTPTLKAINLLNNLRIFDIRDHSCKFNEIESRIKACYPDFVVVDFCQAMNDKASSRNEYERMSNWGLQLQQLAQTYNCAILDLSQLSNESVKEDYIEAGFIPFKGSGGLYFSADVGVLIKRDKESSPNIMQVHVRKHKYAATDKFFLDSNFVLGEFTPLEKKEAEKTDNLLNLV